MGNDQIDGKEYAIGISCALSSMVMWGVLPIYWKLLYPIDSMLIMLYRLVETCIIVFVVSLFIYGWKGIIEPLKRKGAIIIFTLAGICISFNWGLYIFMVNKGYVIQTSIGYYIEPLMVCLFGVIFFHEKMNRYKSTAILFAIAGVIVMVFSYGQIPVMALGLAIAFATYAAIKKKMKAPALLALFYETVFLLPLVIPWIISYEMSGKGVIHTAEMSQIAWLSLAGLFTAIPLSLFGMAANRISLISLGITEYIAPSIALLLGIFLFKEAFDFFQLAGFTAIWIGLAIFTIGEIKERRRLALSFGLEGDKH
ncbi:MAG: EamA family transporter RarD [Anaerovoracaceae bacterium]|jgi:chloramphenicol-sensitive protein RarD